MNLYDLGINVTRQCNMNCPHCFYSSLSKKDSSSNNQKIEISISEIEVKLSDSNLRYVYICGGEPFCRKDLRDVIEYFEGKSSKVLIATNGSLIDDEWLEYLAKANVTLLWSVKRHYAESISRIKRALSLGVDVHVYHVLDDYSPEVLSAIVYEIPDVNRVRLLFKTGSSKKHIKIFDFCEWFRLVDKAMGILRPIESKCEVEIGYLPNEHTITKDRRGAVDRLFMDVDGLFYPCPLLVENGNGKENISLEKCCIEKCPALNQKVKKPEQYSLVCPFVLMGLKELKEYLPGIYYENNMEK
ncbi:MAG: radical SAM protein [Oligoflexales bacterium]|nr:radical SAM protein [Oligoflexales bacterium]